MQRARKKKKQESYWVSTFSVYYGYNYTNTTITV